MADMLKRSMNNCLGLCSISDEMKMMVCGGFNQIQDALLKLRESIFAKVKLRCS